MAAADRLLNTQVAARVTLLFYLSLRESLLSLQDGISAPPSVLLLKGVLQWVQEPSQGK